VGAGAAEAMKRLLVALPLCLALISCDDAAPRPTVPVAREPTQNHEPPPEWPSVHDSLMTVPEGDCAYVGGRQKIGCIEAPLDKLMFAVNAGRNWRAPYIQFAWITGTGGPTRCTVVVSGVWDNDVLKVADDIGRRREVLLMERNDHNGPWLVCRDDGLFPSAWPDGTPIKSQRSANAERVDTLSTSHPIGRSE